MIQGFYVKKCDILTYTKFKSICKKRKVSASELLMLLIERFVSESQMKKKGE